MLSENEILSLVLLPIEVKLFLKLFEITIELEIAVPLIVRLLEISPEMFLMGS